MKQITLIIEDDHPGIIADLSELLAHESINIDDVDAERASDHGVIMLAVDHYDHALRVLRDAGYQAISEDALVIRLADKPGALAQVAVRFRDAAINIRSMRIVRREEGFSLVAIVTPDSAAAKELLKDVLVSR